jgi:hypothetical protein
MNYTQQIREMDKRLRSMAILCDQLQRDWKAMEAEFGDQSTMANVAFNAWDEMKAATTRYRRIVGMLENANERL